MEFVLHLVVVEVVTGNWTAIRRQILFTPWQAAFSPVGHLGPAPATLFMYVHMEKRVGANWERGDRIWHTPVRSTPPCFLPSGQNQSMNSPVLLLPAHDTPPWSTYRLQESLLHTLLCIDAIFWGVACKLKSTYIETAKCC